MFDKWMKYSYAAQKYQRFRLLRIFLIFLSLYVLYNVITAFFCSIWVVENDAMHSDTVRSGLTTGDRLALVSFSIPSLIGDLRPGAQSFPFKRGSVVLVDTGRGGQIPLYRKLLDSCVRFFTAQRLSVFKNEEHLYIKRVIALPGDEISMTNFVFRVKPSDSSYSLTEFELADRPYYPVIPHVPALWDESLPLSPNMGTVVLGADECFVVSDDRGNTNDSRTWGPVPSDYIAARAVFRFWPPSRIGRP